ncbi:MAG: bluetail domain-containing putative surface protein [Microcystaceae cyanobacterium]
MAHFWTFGTRNFVAINHAIAGFSKTTDIH